MLRLKRSALPRAHYTLPAARFCEEICVDTTIATLYVTALVRKLLAEEILTLASNILGAPTKDSFFNTRLVAQVAHLLGCNCSEATKIGGILVSRFDSLTFRKLRNPSPETLVRHGLDSPGEITVITRTSGGMACGCF